MIRTNGTEAFVRTPGCRPRGAGSSQRGPAWPQAKTTPKARLYHEALARIHRLTDTDALFRPKFNPTGCGLSEQVRITDVAAEHLEILVSRGGGNGSLGCSIDDGGGDEPGS